MKELTIKVTGMMCGGCENRIKNALECISRVQTIEANHETGLVKVTCDGQVSRGELVEAIEDIGFGVEE